MDRSGIAHLVASMLSGTGLPSGDAGFEREVSYSQFTRHATKKGPGRSKGMKLAPTGNPGDKIARKAFNGMCGLRGGVGAAGRLALEGKLCRAPGA